MPTVWAPADAKIGERDVRASMLETDADLVAAREGVLLISDKGFAAVVNAFRAGCGCSGR